MSRIRFARCLLILLLVAIVSTPSAWGAPFRLPSRVTSVDVLAWAWESLVVLWGKGGAHLDPHGLSANPTPTDEGCIIDPHGACASVHGATPVLPPPMEEGCGIDPHGVC